MEERLKQLGARIEKIEKALKSMAGAADHGSKGGRGRHLPGHLSLVNANICW